MGFEVKKVVYKGGVGSRRRRTSTRSVLFSIGQMVIGPRFLLVVDPTNARLVFA
jgi:hypothetical protein